MFGAVLVPDAPPSPPEPPTRCHHCGLEGARCRSCDAAILWAKSATTGKAFPLDFAVTTVAMAGTIQGGDVMDWLVVKGHVPHHITCPQGRSWSRKSHHPPRSPHPGDGQAVK